ncbi:hypothetical protein JQ617_29215 [Bradyrhizobium sp. KB893862 SZCCT0404]|uniref:hypothetical protein n=1 Tax=Bradyrhizobium sp. KB893862 SZCCT0404 TaxID=2807672 RepID=UPI001BADF378|nr:hypothetical protein [Bradyrhizobium sp. KB893862 SZCCT0404]MBR1178072.1 hypothetical protein [Bradyrhizobium sp. KB893862 SZCCT0404]
MSVSRPTKASMPSLRPHLTVFFDLATRAPLGHHVGFEPLSIESSLLALRQAIHETEWDAWGCPTEIPSDPARPDGAPDSGARPE